MPTIITRGAASAKAYGFASAKAAGVVVDVAFTTPGTYTWVAPACISSVSIVAVGGGGGAYLCGSLCGYGGGGGALAYKNNYSVTAGNSYTVVVGSGGTKGTSAAVKGTNSYFCSTSVVNAPGSQICNYSGAPTGTGGGRGGYTTSAAGSGIRGGAGAGGYSGNGGRGYGGGGGCYTLTSGSGGAGGGGVGTSPCGSGGGVGLYGQGSSGMSTNCYTGGGGGGSCGTAGTSSSGGLYGGGGLYRVSCGVCHSAPKGGCGAVRIVGPGCKHQFPSTCVQKQCSAYGSQSYTSAGTFTWVAPAGVTSVSVVAIGHGGSGEGYFNCAYYAFGGYGGGLGYKNNIAVTPGTGYTVKVSSCANQPTYFINACTVAGGANTAFTGDGGGTGGNLGVSAVTCNPYGAGGGGAGGYTGSGGNGGYIYNTSGTAGAGGGAGGGSATGTGQAGGGVGLYGKGCNGGANGGGGSGGNSASGGTAGLYGGGARGYSTNAGPGSPTIYAGAVGAVRIMWPGTQRAFPSTNASYP